MNRDRFAMGRGVVDLARLGFRHDLHRTRNGRLASHIARSSQSSISYLPRQFFALLESNPSVERMTFTLVRHAETRHNERGLLAGSLFDPGAHITEMGRRRLLDITLPEGSLIFHSRLTRASETAKVLATTSNGRLISTHHGEEMCFGGFEGRRLKDLVESDRAFGQLYFEGDAMAAYPGSECFADVVIRAGLLVDEIMDAIRNEPGPELHVVFVGHAIINQAVRILAGDLYDEDNGHFVCDGVDPRFTHMPNASVLRVLDVQAERPWVTTSYASASLS